MVGIIPHRRETISCVLQHGITILEVLFPFVCNGCLSASLEALSILYVSNTLRLYLLYAGMGSNKHAESSYLKKKQEDKKEMRKYKVSCVVRENL